MSWRPLDLIVTVLLIIGGLNWGLMGFFGVNVIASIFGAMSVISRIIYALVGLAALYEVFQFKAAQCRICGPSHTTSTMGYSA